MKGIIFVFVFSQTNQRWTQTLIIKLQWKSVDGLSQHDMSKNLTAQKHAISASSASQIQNRIASALPKNGHSARGEFTVFNHVRREVGLHLCRVVLGAAETGSWASNKSARSETANRRLVLVPIALGRPRACGKSDRKRPKPLNTRRVSAAFIRDRKVDGDCIRRQPFMVVMFSSLCLDSVGRCRL